MILSAILVCVPWTWRNYSVLGEFFFMRSNFGLELRMGNHEGAVADVEAMDRREGDGMPHPGINLTEAQLCRDLGEAEYMRRARTKAFSWIRAHPDEFLRLTGCRILHTWFGPWYTAASVAAFITLLTILGAIGLWRAWPAMSVPQRVAVLSPILFFPLVYYVVVYMPRYRVPIDWVVFLAAGAAIWPARRSASGREKIPETSNSSLLVTCRILHWVCAFGWGNITPCRSQIQLLRCKHHVCSSDPADARLFRPYRLRLARCPPGRHAALPAL